MPFLRAAASPQLQTIIAKQVCDSPVARSSYFFFFLQEKPEMWIFFKKRSIFKHWKPVQKISITTSQ